MKILVTGRNGQLARSFARLADRRSNEVWRFLGRAEADLAIPGAIGQAIRNERPDVVINTAAYTEVDAAESHVALARRINATAAGEAAAAAAEVGARFIQISTDYVFDGQGGAPYREADPTGPVNAYGRSKLEGEREVRAAHPGAIIVRSSWIVSPFGRNFVATMLRLASARDEVGVVADQRGCPTSAMNLAEALLKIAGEEDAAGSTVHLAGHGDASWADLAQAVMDHLRAIGLPAALVRRITTAQFPTDARRPADTRLDCDQAWTKFGIRLPDWQASLPAIVEELAS